MIAAGDFRNGTTFELDGQVCQIIEFQHAKTARGPAVVRTKLKNINTGSTIERTFNPTEKFNEAQLERKEMSYIYEDSGLYYFMDLETYDQIPYSKNVIGDSIKFLKEGMQCKIISYKETVFSIDLPLFVDLLITEAEPGVKGDTAQNATKTVVLETGATVKVPLFVNEGEMIRIDTRTGQYIERVAQ